ncbi:MAG: dUTP diphosphatase [Alphaproteobacteria bacterium]
MSDVAVSVVRLPHAADLPLPAYATDAAAGMDLLAAVAAPQSIAPGARALVPTGLTIALPEGYEGQVRPRSGLALRHGVTVLNAPGTIDADYRGEVAVVLVNFGDAPFTVERGMRVAQLIVAPVSRARWAEVAALPDSVRGAGGFGSTGLAGATKPGG